MYTTTCMPKLACECFPSLIAAGGHPLEVMSEEKRLFLQAMPKLPVHFLGDSTRKTSKDT